MKRLRFLLVGSTAVVVVAAASKAPFKTVNKPVPVAETKLLMEGLNQPNFRGLERLLREKPADVETWNFIRGQALLIAETGNLLMLRPPRASAETQWLDYCAELRFAATRLARSAANKDYDLCRTVLGDVAGACNRCHETFHVKVRIQPFAKPVLDKPPTGP